MVRGVHKKSGIRRSVSIKGHTRKDFSGFRVGPSNKSGIEEAPCLYSRPERQELRSLQANKDDGAPCKTRTGDTIPRAETFGDLKDVNLVIIIDTQPLYKILLLNGNNRIRAKLNLLLESMYINASLFRNRWYC